jgi:hypothetical protein
MTWSVSSVIAALNGNAKSSDAVNESLIDMKLFDRLTGIGIGIDGLGQRILVLPGQEDVSGFTTTNADFDPVCKVSWLEEEVSLPETATLTCRSDFSNPSVLEAVAVVFLGLIELQEKFGTAGRAIWQMKTLFENDFKTTFSEEALLGLIGEILLINEAEDPESLIRFWHSNPTDAFDFSSENFRLEVKTSQSIARNHSFSSNQIGTIHDKKLIVASIVLSKVEIGSTLKEIVEQLCEKISSTSAQRLMERIISILGCGPELTNHLMFDKLSSISSLILVEGVSVPRPISTPGVISMSWLASLVDSPNVDISLEEVIKRF